MRHGRSGDYTVTVSARQKANARGLILASASPRRRELLYRAGVRFRVVSPRVPERRRPGEPAPAMARRLALAKAVRVAASVGSGFVLGADTIVVLDGRPLGKPPSPAAARRMLRSLSGRWHDVVTALAVVDVRSGRVRCAHARSRVQFHELAPETIRAYVAGGEPMDKAGAYALQGAGAALVRRVRGSRSNVVGLPLPLLSRLLGAIRPE